MHDVNVLKCHRTIHFKMINFMLFIFCQNKNMVKISWLKYVSHIPHPLPECDHFSPSHPPLKLSHEHTSHLDHCNDLPTLASGFPIQSAKSQPNHVPPLLKIFPLFPVHSGNVRALKWPIGGYLTWLPMTFLSSPHALSQSAHLPLH